MSEFNDLIEKAESIVGDTYSEFGDEYDNELPRHGFEVLMDNAAAIGQTLVEIDTAEAADEELSDDAKQARLEDDVVDVLLSIATISYEHDLDVAGAFENRLELMDEWSSFEDAMNDLDEPTQAEVGELMDEHLSDEAIETFLGGMGDGGPTVGENVDAGEYDHERADMGYQ